MNKIAAFAGALVLVGGWSAVAVADEARSPISVSKPDGTVRYGGVTITARNPCPPGTHYEPPPLPGRFVRK
jgi:hypothetical protein